ncbi:helix-turn-helix transcriptional regulator [Sphingobacterium oryzagri]|uniref:Helix-turn-helix transcriptional regulator n=1 Tax=Sphingobacterium oryzagri TaxID=3025669 RepID=A0ABY7WFQ8_9SPHI|nr:helix-turn-helix transcriptional regulator [Sphingobacterium sp. KACC 22765]WDF68033.1 helix-turn-helix transcriptional regulator [Sphingobacterium sp. KACC 22765]
MINKDILASIGTRIRKAREELSYSQNDVASMTGLTVNTIASLEKGKGASLNNFLLTCRALKIQPRSIFQEDIDLSPLYNLPPSSKKRREINQRLDDLVYHSDFFVTPKRVADVLKKLNSDKSDSNKFSVYLTAYCKEGELGYVKEGNIKKYVKKKS